MTDTSTGPAGVTAGELKQFIERVERLTESKQEIADDIRDVLTEAKSSGYIPAIIRQVVKLRRMDRQKREEAEAILDTYISAIGGV